MSDYQMILKIISVAAFCFFVTKNAIAFTEAHRHRKYFKNMVTNDRHCYVSDYPFAVAVFSRSLCGGSLITLEWVLTAAHCIDPLLVDNNQTTVRSGYNSPKDSVQVRYAKLAVVHTKFSYSRMIDDIPDIRYDIGLVLVRQAFVKSPTLSPVALPKPGFTKTCTRGRALGVGFELMDKPKKILLELDPGFEMQRPKRPTGGPLARPLKCSDLYIIEKHVCVVTYPGSIIDDTILCTLTEGGYKDTCHGDSGGPLLCDGGKVIIGVISTGMGCGIPFRSSSYAKVETFLPFISEAMKRGKGFRSEDRKVIKAGGGRSSLWNVVDVIVLSYVTTMI